MDYKKINIKKRTKTVTERTTGIHGSDIPTQIAKNCSVSVQGDWPMP